MDAVALYARGKINWALKILGRRPDGYHELDTLFQSVEVGDVLRIQRAERDELVCGAAFVPGDESNLAFRALGALRQIAPGFPVRMTLEKRIPVAGGMAGGSADAAAALLGLDRLWGLNLPRQRLMEVGLTLGADVPFCLMGGAARSFGVGERLRALSVPVIHLVLANPGQGVSTPRAFQALDYRSLDGVGLDGVQRALVAGDLSALNGMLANDLLSPALKLCPPIQRLLQLMRSAGATAVGMSGSGPTVFGIFPTARHAQRAAKRLRPRTAWCEATQTAQEGLSWIE